jgi:hypothetical protein
VLSLQRKTWPAPLETAQPYPTREDTNAVSPSHTFGIPSLQDEKITRLQRSNQERKRACHESTRKLIVSDERSRGNSNLERHVQSNDERVLHITEHAALRSGMLYLIFADDVLLL